MANQHITAVFKCSKFKGITRLVLLYLSDAASPLSVKDAKAQKKLPFGYCKRKLTTIMAAVNCSRQPTISACLTELKDTGAIKQWRKKHLSALYFVDLEWLKQNARVEEEDETIRKAFAQPISDPSDEGETPEAPVESTLAVEEPYGDPRETLELPYSNGNRLLSNEKRMVLDTESVSESNGNRLHSIPSDPTPSLRSGDFDPPAVAGCSFPPAAQGQDTTGASLDPLRGDTGETPGPPQTSGALPLKPRRRGFSPPDPSADCSPAAQPPIPPSPKRQPGPEFHNWVREHGPWSGEGEERTRMACGALLNDIKFSGGPFPCVVDMEPGDEVELPKSRAFEIED